MMVMTLVTVLFAPITFISSYFGMNFMGGEGIDEPFYFCESCQELIHWTSQRRMISLTCYAVWYIAVPVLVLFTLLVFSFMLWDSISDFFKKRGLAAHRHKRGKARSRWGT